MIALGAGAVVMMAIAAPSGAPEDLRYITTSSDASSDCIGDPRTPLCAFDTWEACFLWGDASLCERVGLPGMVFRAGGGEDKQWVYVYRPTASIEIEARHLADIEAGRFAALRPKQEWFRPGYVDIRYADQLCEYPSYDNCTTFGGGNAIIVKPVGNVWHVSGWISEVGDVACEYYDSVRDYPPWEHHCVLNILSQEFLDYEKSRRSADSP